MSRVILLLAAVLACSCVATRKDDSPSDWIARDAAVAALNVWSLDGRISMKLAQRGFNGGLRWQQHDEIMQIDVNGPLGFGAFRISGSADALVLERSDGQQYSLDDPDSALNEQLGWGVPVAALPFWLRGIAYPPWPVRARYDSSGQLAYLEQDDWTVQYDRYMTADTWLMPRKLTITGADAQLKLVVTAWHLGAQHSHNSEFGPR